MPVIALCPTADSISPIMVNLANAPLIVSAPVDGVRWVAHVAGQLAKTAQPLVLVLHGETAVHAPALGFSRRALHRPAVAYILVDPVLPAVGGEYGDWPDAPVTVVLTDPENRDVALQAQLRGWSTTNDDVQTVLNAQL